MTKTEKAIAWMLDIAADPAHGYDQAQRWGERGDYDCSSLVISAFEQAGIPVKTCGATYTGNMKAVFLRCGFKDVTSSVNRATGAGLQRGDVLLNEVSHTAMYIGGGQIAHAAGNENGRATGGKPGDQTGGEICVRSYYNSPWDCVLRLDEAGHVPAVEESGADTCKVELPEISYGEKSEAVRAMQALLVLRGENVGSAGADGEYGPDTESAVRAFQMARGLKVDGVCGEKTWTRLIRG